MTIKEKERKIKLILLILLVNTEYARRQPFKNIFELIEFAIEQLKWLQKFRMVLHQKTGVFISGSEQLHINNKNK